MIKDIIFWASNFNISYIVKFHEFVNDLLKTKENELSEKISKHPVKDDAFINLKVEKNIYSETYRRHLMNTTFLMLYSHFEEWIYIIWKKFGKK